MDAVKLLGSLMGNKSLASGLGGKLLGSLLGGGQQQAPQQSAGGGLAGLLGGVLGGGGGASQGGGAMSGLLGMLGGGGGAGGGALSGLLGSVMGGGSDAPAAAPAPAPAQQAAANDQAVLMIRAMVNAAKSDGRIDQTEQENIISKLGSDVSEAEVNFLKQEFAAPLDVESFARSVPKGLEQQIYAMSLTSIELDTQNEAQYLGKLAQGLNIDPNLCNQIHDHVGAPKIFG
jgi:uncharacterized membrane protein YebE (DUF533 family)